MNQKPILVILQQLPPFVQEALGQHFEVRFETPDYISRPLNANLYQGAKVLLTTPFTATPASYMQQLPQSVGLIANIGVGYDHIDLAQAAKQEILVSNTPNAMNDEVANITMGLITNLYRKLRASEDWLRSGKWGKENNPNLVGTRIAGKQLGLIGFGGIGKEVARRAAAFKMKVFYHKPNPVAAGENTFGATYEADLKNLLKTSDIISLHCPLLPATTHLINEANLNLMKDSAIIINTGRGALIDENALVAALKNKVISGAGLDVFEKEPIVQEGLLTLENVILVPHIGSATAECRMQMFQMAIQNVQQFLTKGKVINRVYSK